MLRSKQELEAYLTRKFNKIIVDTELCKRIYDYANRTYDIPKDLISDLVSLRKNISEASEFVLFVILESIDQISLDHLERIQIYFTEKEIEYYKNAKYKVNKVKFPLVFNMIQISHDQWIGNISSKELMLLRKAQLINYNENAQRTMQRIIRGDKEIYKITVNQTAVSAIQNSYNTGIYIPNTLTLNIPLETEYNFKYDNERKQLIIRELEHFDITDGYHRYVALCQSSDMNEDFDYPMELRIINFSEDKAKQFIFQEDQKTKMRKVDSESMNNYRAANIVTNRLNESMQCNLQGMIGASNKIQIGDFSALVHYFYFRGRYTKDVEKNKIIQVTKHLIDNFNYLTENAPEYLNKIYTYPLLLVIFTVFEEYKNKDKEKMIDVISYVYENINRIEIGRLSSSNIKKSLVNDVIDIIREAEEYV